MPYWVLLALVWCVCTFPLALPGTVHAITIAFDLQVIGVNQYRSTYAVTNDGSLGAGVPVELFDIAFDPALYEEASLTIVTPDPPASAWSELILASVPGVPAVYDALALAGGIPDGATVAGFAVEFVWLGGPDGPGSQSQVFEVSDPNTFMPLPGGSGVTAPLQVTGVPEPGTFFLLGMGLLGLVWWRLTRRNLYT